MKVSLVYYTGMGMVSRIDNFPAKLLIYTKSTRLEQGEDTYTKVMNMTPGEVHKELEYIANTIRSSWEFLDFHFQIEGVTRAFTHQFVRTRTMSFAQQSQRTLTLSEVGVAKPETVKPLFVANHAWDRAVDVIEDSYNDMIHCGIPAQDARGILPTNVLTNIYCKLNLRTFADLVGKRDNPRAQGEYTDVIKAMVKEAEGAMPWIHRFLYPERNETPALDNLMKELIGTATPASLPQVNAALKELDKLKAVWG